MPEQEETDTNLLLWIYEKMKSWAFKCCRERERIFLEIIDKLRKRFKG